jgi:hypothetical protein
MNKSKNFLENIAKALDELLNDELKGNDRKIGFVLLIFPFNSPDMTNVNYISNGNRKDLIIAMKEIIARFEGQSTHIGKA